MIFKTVAARSKRKFTVGTILLALLFLDILTIFILAIVAYLPQNYRDKDLILQSTFAFNIGLIVILMLCAIYYVFFRNKNRKYIGALELSPSEIILNNETYPLDQIENIRIKGNDIRGEFRGFSSKGTNNQIFIQLKNKEEHSSNFEQTTEINLKNAENILKEYYQKAILTEANLETILNNTNYY